MTGDKYSELRRIDHSLNNYKLSIQYNIQKLGFEGDLENRSEVFDFLHERVFNANISKKPNVDDPLKEQLVNLFENMWINESFVQSSIENIATSQKVDHHYFYLVYIAFYYSLFTSISIVLRLFDHNIHQETHQRKINGFNQKINSNKFLRECYFKPFSLAISNKEIINLDIKLPKSVEDGGLNAISKIIRKYDNYRGQQTVDGDLIVDEDLYTLKVSKSLIKYYIENGTEADWVSYIHYFMSKRHFLHYNASFIYNIKKGYVLDKLLNNIKKNMIYILFIANSLTELIFTRLTTLEDFKNIYSDFDACLLNCVDDYLTEDDYLHQFENIILRKIYHKI